jgi:isocitrate dehydrogenase
MQPESLAQVVAATAPTDEPAPHPQVRPSAKQELVGVDIFLRWDGGLPDLLGAKLEEQAAKLGALQLKLITNRGVKVYPEGQPETYCTDHWRCRFVATGELPTIGSGYHPVFFADVLALQQQLTAAGLQIIKTENLYLFDGQRGFSLGQGE